jgi:hypothetical protein
MVSSITFSIAYGGYLKVWLPQSIMAIRVIDLIQMHTSTSISITYTRTLLRDFLLSYHKITIIGRDRKPVNHTSLIGSIPVEVAR